MVREQENQEGAKERAGEVVGPPLGLRSKERDAICQEGLSIAGEDTLIFRDPVQLGDSVRAL